MGDRYVKISDSIKVLYIDATNSFGWAISQSLPYDDFKF